VIDSQLLRGERVWLTALSRDDAPVMARWEYDSEFLRLMDSRPARPRSEEEIARWLDGLSKASNAYTLGIRLIDSDELIGFVELDGIDWQHRNCSLGIAIGPRSQWDSGYGSEAMQLMLRFGFDELNLHRILLTVFSYNPRAIHLYEKLGFTLEGRYREHLLRDGQRYDMLIYGLLRHEWAAMQQ
jgi:RimJ/RimL family protein N-acetyltransferase